MVNLCELMPATSVNMGIKYQMTSKAGLIIANTDGTWDVWKNNFAIEFTVYSFVNSEFRGIFSSHTK